MRKHVIIAASFSALAAASVSPAFSPAWAGWGCGARTPKGEIASNWAGSSEQKSRDSLLHDCELGHVQCQIISCSADVDTEAQADAHWPPAASSNYKYFGNCGRYGQPKCND
jgi:hypothetical protein